jgi:hypothetical protein
VLEVIAAVAALLGAALLGVALLWWHGFFLADGLIVKDLGLTSKHDLQALEELTST